MTFFSSFRPALKKLCLEPGVLFPLANIFVFIQAHNQLAVILAFANTALSIVAVLSQRITISPLRITMWMVLAMALCSFWSGSFLPGLAGLAFAAGHFMVTHKKLQQALADPATPALQKAVTHPAFYYGLGGIVVGIMAGGGVNLLRHPLADIPALIMVSSGMIAIGAASLGLALNLVKSAIPFWILAAGTAINGLAGLLTGNFAGATSCLFSLCGNMRLGFMNSSTAQQSE